MQENYDKKGIEKMKFNFWEGILKDIFFEDNMSYILEAPSKKPDKSLNDEKLIP